MGIGLVGQAKNNWLWQYLQTKTVTMSPRELALMNASFCHYHKVTSSGLEAGRTLGFLVLQADPISLFV